MKTNTSKIPPSASPALEQKQSIHHAQRQPKRENKPTIKHTKTKEHTTKIHNPQTKTPKTYRNAYLCLYLPIILPLFALPDMQTAQQITITPKDFAKLSGLSISHCQRLFTRLRKALGKPPRSMVTKTEASTYFNIAIQ